MAGPGIELIDRAEASRRLPEFDRLLEAALLAQSRARAPYSRFQVGAAVLTGSGAIHIGCNVESASYGATICAERSAVVGAVAAGENAIRVCVVVTPTADPSSPCGICRQLLAEFGPEMQIFAASSVGNGVYAARLADLLPLAFWAKNLDAAEPAQGQAADEATTPDRSGNAVGRRPSVSAGRSFELGREIAPAEQGERLDELVAAVRARTGLEPRVGLVLGSGLGGLADSMQVEEAVPFGDLPGWPPATAPGHAGRLLFGRLAGVPAVIQQGRFHLYEGHSAGFVVQPVLLMGRLGAGVVVLTNAAGGVNPAFGAGTLMVITDHLNLTGRHPLVGPNDTAIGERFPDMTNVWDLDLRARLLAAGEAESVELQRGVYGCLTGPSYETPAEVRMLGRLGADAVGMSTVPEAIAAHWAGIRVCGVSLVTNPGAGLSAAQLTHTEVLAAAEAAGPRLARVIARFVAEL